MLENEEENCDYDDGHSGNREEKVHDNSKEHLLYQSVSILHHVNRVVHKIMSSYYALLNRF